MEPEHTLLRGGAAPEGMEVLLDSGDGEEAAAEDGGGGAGGRTAGDGSGVLGREAAGPAPAAPPADPGHRTYWAFFLQGLGMLFPWNVFITAASYFALRFRGTPHEESFEQVFSFCYTIANLLCFVGVLRYGAHPRLDLRAAVVAPSALTGALFLLAALLVFSDVGGEVMYGLTVVSVLLCGACAALLQAGIFGLTARLPPRFIQAVVGGQAAAGAVVSLLSLFALLAQDCGRDGVQTVTLDEIRPQSFAYFFASTVVVCVCLAVFVWLTRSPLVLHYMYRSGGGGGGGGGGGYRVKHNLLRAPVMVGPDNSGDLGRGLPVHLARRIWRHCFGVFITFVVTLALFPGLTAELYSAHNPQDEPCPAGGQLYGYGVWQSFLFLLFNLGDTAGRQLTLLKHRPVASDKVWMWASARVLFVPLFLMCNVRAAPEGNRNITVDDTNGASGAVFQDDFFPVLFVVLMSVSNGYCAGLEMMNAPKVFARPEDQSKAGTLMGFSMTCGLLVGALLSFPVRAISLA